jgi:tetratricopeptide (TPR) repeat protein
MVAKACINYVTEGEGFLKDCDWDSAIAAFMQAILQYEKDSCGLFPVSSKTKKSPKSPLCSIKPEEIAKAYTGYGYALCFNEKDDGGNYEKAIENFGKALNLVLKESQDYYHIIRCRSYAYFLKGLYDRALHDCEIVIQELPEIKKEDKQFALEIRGCIYSVMEKFDNAIDNYKDAIAMNQGSFSLLEHYREACKGIKHD